MRATDLFGVWEGHCRYRQTDPAHVCRRRDGRMTTDGDQCFAEQRQQVLERSADMVDRHGDAKVEAAGQAAARRADLAGGQR